MPPAVKYKKEDIVEAALNIVRKSGAASVTAREVAKELGVSVGPIFTYYDSMDQLKRDVAVRAKEVYRGYVMRGLDEPVPFLGVGHQFLAFARKEKELYKLLFLSDNKGATEALCLSKELARESLMRIYNMDAHTADCYFRDLWLLGFSFSTLIVTDDCPYTEEEIGRVLTEVSLSVCKAYKEIPGMPDGDFDRDALFSELVGK